MPTTRWPSVLPALLVAGSIVPAATATAAADRPAAEILADIRAVAIPEAPKGRTTAEVRAYRQQRSEAEARKNDLILELFKTRPDHPELVDLLPARWNLLLRQGPSKAAEVGREAEAVLKSTKVAALKVEAARVKAELATDRIRDDPDAAVEAIDLFLELAPTDRRGADLLKLAAKSTTDLARKVELRDRLARDFPELQAKVAAPAGGAAIREAIGKPFKLEFTDAISGTPLSMGAFRGKVVVIDFWATWCGPCVAEMPRMKKLYAEYRDRGVEFIGVSLDQPEDQGGLAALKAFVDKHEILWPQYYQGLGWDSPFSRSWNIDAIPRMFVVDADGNLASIDARGRLETLLPELLAKAAKGSEGRASSR